MMGRRAFFWGVTLDKARVAQGLFQWNFRRWPKRFPSDLFLCVCYYPFLSLCLKISLSTRHQSNGISKSSTLFLSSGWGRDFSKGESRLVVVIFLFFPSNVFICSLAPRVDNDSGLVWTRKWRPGEVHRDYLDVWQQQKKRAGRHPALFFWEELIH